MRNEAFSHIKTIERLVQDQTYLKVPTNICDFKILNIT